MDTPNIMQLKSCTYASPSLRFTVSGVSLLSVSWHVFPPNHPTWQGSQTSARVVNPHGVLGSCVSFNSSIFFQYVDEFSSARVHLFIACFWWRHWLKSHLHNNLEKEIHLCSTTTPSPGQRALPGPALQLALLSFFPCPWSEKSIQSRACVRETPRLPMDSNSHTVNRVGIHPNPLTHLHYPQAFGYHSSS